MRACKTAGGSRYFFSNKEIKGRRKCLRKPFITEKLKAAPCSGPGWLKVLMIARGNRAARDKKGRVSELACSFLAWKLPVPEKQDPSSLHTPEGKKRGREADAKKGAHLKQMEKPGKKAQAKKTKVT